MPTAALLAASGCAVVDPEPDYERTSRIVEEATGQGGFYRSGEDEETATRRVEELLEGGLSVAEAVEVCLLKNQTLRAALFEVGLARADVVQSGLLSNPSLGGLVRFPVDGGKSNVEAGLALNLIQLWHLPARKRLSKQLLERKVLRIAYKGATLVAQTKAAYYSAAAAEQTLVVEGQNAESAQTFLDLVLARQQAGAATEVDVNAARSEVLDQEVVLRSAQLEAFDSKRRLAVVLGVETSPEGLELTDQLPPLPQWSVGVDRVLSLARAHRLDLQAASENLRAAEHAVSLEKRLFLRTAGAGVALETEGSDVSLGPSASLQLPIFDQNQAQIAKAEMRYAQAQKNLEALTVSVAQQVRGTHARFRAALDIARSYQEKILPLSESNLELARESFQAGKTGFLSVLTAQRKLLSSRRASIERLRALSQSVPELEAVSGRPLHDILSGEGEPHELEASEEEK